MATKTAPKQNLSIHPESRRMSDRLERMQLANDRWNAASEKARVGMFKPNNRPCRSNG